MKKLHLYLLIMGLFIHALCFAKEYHVSIKGSDTNDGSASKPFRTISQAVIYDFPGDTITVHSGTYRELINPIRGGESDSKRIVYRAAPGEKVDITQGPNEKRAISYLDSMMNLPFTNASKT